MATNDKDFKVKNGLVVSNGGTFGQPVTVATPTSASHATTKTYVDTALTSKAPTASPTFTGTVTLPSTTSIGTVSDTEISYLDGVTSSIQTQINSKASLSGATFTGAISGTDLTLSGNLTVNGTTTNINSTNLVVEDKNIVIGDTASPSDVSADGGGITLKGTTDKTINWVDATDSWTSSENVNLATNKTFKIAGTDVLTATQVLGKVVPSGTIIGTTDTQTLTNKTIDLGSNTVSGTLAQFNTAVTDADLASLAGVETLTNKTINGANNTLTVRIASDVSGLGTGIATFLATPSSANLASAVTDETGSGLLVFATSPALSGTPTAPTASIATDNTQIATTNFVNASINDIPNRNLILDGGGV